MFDVVYGVDFSGARLAGRTMWLAEMAPDGPLLRLGQVDRLERLCGTAARGEVLRSLVGMISSSERALWALNFPFGLPVGLLAEGSGWRDQFALLAGWEHDPYAWGVEMVRRAKLLGGPWHIRRLTDRQEQTPFDTYHYRIVYQTFHGMHDVLRPLVDHRRTAILPFQHRRLPTARRVVVEACPASTLRRLGLPRVNYKQPEGGPLTAKRRRNRRAILDGLAPLVAVSAGDRLRLMRDGGADGLDAVLCGVGAWRCWRAYDHHAIGRNRYYSREGRHYA